MFLVCFVTKHSCSSNIHYCDIWCGWQEGLRSSL